MPIAPFGWSIPALLWIGPEFMAPECPADRAKVVAYEGRADLSPLECFGCSCKAPTGSCERPSVMKAYPNPDCTGMMANFSAPDPWDGVCLNAGPMPPLLDVRSVLIEPVTMTESDCEPEQHDIPRDGSPKWGTFARACLGNGFTTPCPDPSDYCAPTSEPPPEGFSQCVYKEGDQTCPPSYPSKHVFYKDATDMRTCSGCSCGAPQGGVCSTSLWLYEEPGCAGEPITKTTVTSTASACQPLPGGIPLESKLAPTLWYAPGFCEPTGGEPVGPVELVGASTFCCHE